MSKTDQAALLLKAGKTDAEICIALSCSISVVSLARKFAGLPKLKRGPKTTGERLALIAAMRKAGMTLEKIGDQLRVSKQCINQILNRQKYLARQKVAEWMKVRNVTRPSFCCFCGSSHQIEAHHPDYTEPLFVLWLCESCHTKEDVATKKAKAGGFQIIALE